MEPDGSFSPPENVTELNSPALDAAQGCVVMAWKYS